MQIFATTVDHVQNGLLPTVLLDAEGRSDIAVLLDNPLFALAAIQRVEWKLEPGAMIHLHVEVHAYSSVTLETDFSWAEYGAWLIDVAAANILRLIPVVDPTLLEQSLLEPGAPGVTIRNVAQTLQPIVAQLKTKKGLF
jgi:hypothetical protein